jgi:predicted acetyltransferase
MPKLIPPTTQLRDSWLAAREEWGRETHQDGAGLRAGDDVGHLGAISLRLTLNDFLLRAGGHIGYGVRPSARRRGLATWALGAVLPEARALGLERVLVTCDDANVASARTIESNGGVLEDVRVTELGQTRRYWIAL